MHIIVLEAASVGSTPKTRSISSFQQLDYDSGVVMRVADSELTYQQEGETNLAEALLLHARDVSGVKAQHGPSISNCDATSYVLFSNCPYVVSLAIPTQHKHNFDPV
ncbi:MAG: hypothetical protein JO202_02335 [Ktedonobacteraceae bacterium]|nr:hypothetical protein [Ktedonobacteraceae bacterium]